MQGWLYTVLWPLREALAHELHLLDAGDTTWRYGSARLDGIRPPAAHLDAAGRANLDDLIAIDAPDLRDVIDRCITAQARLAEAARQTHGVLVHELRDAVARAPHRIQLGDDDAVEQIAEDLINKTLEREIANREAQLIDAIRDQLPRLRNGHHEALDATCREAAAATRALLALVDAARERLCDDYDLPPAPVVVHAPRGRAPIG